MLKIWVDANALVPTTLSPLATLCKHQGIIVRQAESILYVAFLRI